MSVKRHSIILFLTLLVPWAGYGSVSAQTGTDDLRQSRSIYQNAASNQAALYSGSVEEPYKYFFHGTLTWRLTSSRPVICFMTEAFTTTSVCV